MAYIIGLTLMVCFISAQKNVYNCDKFATIIYDYSKTTDLSIRRETFEPTTFLWSSFAALEKRLLFKFGLLEHVYRSEMFFCSRALLRAIIFFQFQFIGWASQT